MKGSTFVGFLVGAASGSLITWFVTKSKYEKIMDEEAESFREKLRELKKEESAPEEEESEEESPSDKKKRNDELVESFIKGVKEIQDKHQHVKYSDAEDKNDDEESEDSKKDNDDYTKKVTIEEITREQWDENEPGYEQCGINVYTGGFDLVFTDDADKEMSEGYIADTIGIDIRDKILDSEEYDDMYVRNHAKKTDYEIIFDLQSWKTAHNRE